jgi:hypothetical protein
VLVEAVVVVVELTQTVQVEIQLRLMAVVMEVFLTQLPPLVIEPLILVVGEVVAVVVQGRLVRLVAQAALAQ